MKIYYFFEKSRKKSKNQKFLKKSQNFKISIFWKIFEKISKSKKISKSENPYFFWLRYIYFFFFGDQFFFFFFCVTNFFFFFLKKKVQILFQLFFVKNIFGPDFEVKLFWAFLNFENVDFWVLAPLKWPFFLVLHLKYVSKQIETECKMTGKVFPFDW